MLVGKSPLDGKAQSPYCHSPCDDLGSHLSQAPANVGEVGGSADMEVPRDS